MTNEDERGRLYGDDTKSAKSKTKDFLDAELHALSRLSLNDGETELDKLKLDDK